MTEIHVGGTIVQEIKPVAIGRLVADLKSGISDREACHLTHLSTLNMLMR